jgi:general secretion pathway protein G
MLERLNQKRNDGGFTLIELLIVIIILAILAAIVVFAVGNTGQNAAAASCQADAKATETALESYKAQQPYTYPAADAWATIVPKYLRAEPSALHYEINFDNAGHVSADKAGVGAYAAGDDIDQLPPGPNLAAICAANAS